MSDKSMTVEEFKILNDRIIKNITKNCSQPYKGELKEESSHWLFIKRLNEYRSEMTE